MKSEGAHTRAPKVTSITVRNREAPQQGRHGRTSYFTRRCQNIEQQSSSEIVSPAILPY